MYITEKNLTGWIEEEEGIISPGSRTICHAMATISRKESRDTDQNQTKVMFKLDSCGSVFIAHADHLIRVKSAKPYGLQNIRLLGIGEKTNYLTEEMRKRSSCWASTPWWKRALTYFNTWKIHSRGIACNSLFGLRERATFDEVPGTERVIRRW